MRVCWGSSTESGVVHRTTAGATPNLQQGQATRLTGMKEECCCSPHVAASRLTGGGVGGGGGWRGSPRDGKGTSAERSFSDQRQTGAGIDQSINN